MKKAICFDLDGVLVDACEWHRVAFNNALMQYTGKTISLEDHYKNYNGLPSLKKLELLGITDLSLCEKINDRKQELTIELIKNLTIDYEKVKLLDYLKKQGFKIACVTNSVRPTTEMMLKKTGQFNFFDCIITNQDIKNPKPNSEGYVQAMVTLQTFPKNTWIVEDSEKGITAAKNTGANVIIVNNATEVTTENIINYL